MALEPTLTSFVALDLLTWQENGVLRLSPKFQRRGVWKPAARSYFIDTMLQGFPVPPLHIRLEKDAARLAPIREVVDGQQRLRALFDFVAGKIRLSPQLKANWHGRTFAQLDSADSDRLLEYKFQVYQYQNVDDATILEVFARMNTYSVALNQQELRNGRYFGVFKRTVYELGLDRLEYWRQHNLLTESAITRMAEAQLVGELLVMQMDGLQDKKGALDDFYARYDETWSPDQAWTTRGVSRPAEYLSAAESVSRLNTVLDVISASLGDTLARSEFRRLPLFYTLFAAVYHRLFGLPKSRLPSPRTSLSADAVIRLRETLDELSELVNERPSEDGLRGWQHDFVVASARQTDNLAPREDRLRVLWERAELGMR